MSFLLKLKSALLFFLVFCVIVGIIYPLFITGISALFFKQKADGSLIIKNGKVIGSELIGQYNDDNRYFWGRASATSPFPYNAAASSGSNLGPTNPELIQQVKIRVEQLKKTDDTELPIPVEMVTSSASGLDPDLSVASAFYQLSRVAHARNIEESRIEELIKQHTKERFLGLIGEAHINVLKLNLALDEMADKQ